MKIFNKRRLPHNLRILGSHILKNSFNPFSLKSRLNSPSKVSDFFIWSPNFNKIEFIAENINALSKEDHELVKICAGADLLTSSMSRTYCMLAAGVFARCLIGSIVEKKEDK